VLGAIESARRAVTDALAAWRAAEMDDVPSRDAIERREDALSRRAAELAGQLDEEQALARAYEVLLAQEQLGTLTAAMEAEGGAGAADDPTVHEQRLQARLNSSRAALRLIEDTRKAVVAYTAQLKTQAEDFSSKFLLPLNDLIDAFNRALLSTPGETVQFNAAHTVERTSLGMRLRYADPIENARYRTELPPQLVLSEGQMAANGFSICAPRALPIAGRAGPRCYWMIHSNTTTLSTRPLSSTLCGTWSRSRAISSSCRATSATRVSSSPVSSTRPVFPARFWRSRPPRRTVSSSIRRATMPLPGACSSHRRRS